MSDRDAINQLEHRGVSLDEAIRFLEVVTLPGMPFNPPPRGQSIARLMDVPFDRARKIANDLRVVGLVDLTSEFSL